MVIGTIQSCQIVKVNYGQALSRDKLEKLLLEPLLVHVSPRKKIKGGIPCFCPNWIKHFTFKTR